MRYNSVAATSRLGFVRQHCHHKNWVLQLLIVLFVAYFPAILGPLATLGTYAIARMLSDESSLSVTKAVASLSILNLITTPARRLLFVIPLGLQSVGSFSRIQKFLQYEKDTEETVNSNFNDSEQDVSEKTVDSESKFMLATPQHMSEADTFFAPAKFTAITGPIGCGKSTLLKALLSKTSSRLDLSTDIAYCGQTPWIHDGTIRDNIVGASDLDALWYKEVVHSCELDFDLTRMPDGDATAVGSGGQRLSGGQRQRIVSTEFTHKLFRVNYYRLLRVLCMPKRQKRFLMMLQMHLTLAHYVP
jgi:ATP-binding cassette subfamily C (CFTR/MRP) protein 1